MMQTRRIETCSCRTQPSVRTNQLVSERQGLGAGKQRDAPKEEADSQENPLTCPTDFNHAFRSYVVTRDPQLKQPT